MGPCREDPIKPGLWNQCGGFGVESIRGFNRFGVAVPPRESISVTDHHSDTVPYGRQKAVPGVLNVRSTLTIAPQRPGDWVALGRAFVPSERSGD